MFLTLLYQDNEDPLVFTIRISGVGIVIRWVRQQLILVHVNEAIQATIDVVVKAGECMKTEEDVVEELGMHKEITEENHTNFYRNK